MIPFNRPTLVGEEIENILNALDRGQLAGDGYYTRYCEGILEEIIPGSKCYLTHSCTAALEMCAILCDLGLGDEVIMPSFTFVSTANAVVLRGATPIFVDIERETLNIDPELIEAAITPRTKAIFVVHYAGVVADMDRILSIAVRHKLLVVEDAAQALGSKYKGRPAGSFGHFAAISFHETKNIISGEGGALIVNDDRFIDRAFVIREKGTNRRAFFEGFVDKYTWVDIGSSFLPGELISAFLAAQLQKASDITSGRVQIWDKYFEAFESLERRGIIYRPRLSNISSHNGHIFYFLARSPLERREFISFMRENEVMTPFHYIPLHSSPAGVTFGRCPAGSLPVTDDLSSRLVRLPLFSSIKEEDTEKVISLVYEFFGEGR